MMIRFAGRFRNFLGDLRLNKKIQLSLLTIILPLFILFFFLFISMYSNNQHYDKIITNASEAGRFSIKFKQEFDYKIYLLIAGHSSFEEEDPYKNINEARGIVYDLIHNTGIDDNRHRAETIMKLLDNLEKYVKRIETNKKIGGHYDDNIAIWENDVQTVTALIQTNVLEYTYYETKGMEQVRARISASIGRIMLYSLIVFFLLLCLAVFLSIRIPNSIVMPIHHLNDVTNQVAKGDLTVRAGVLRGAEVRQLGESLNYMIEKIDQLLLAVKIDERNLREAELELLQAQINPHFLYNTLDTIIWLAESGRQGEVVEMVDALSGFFRTSLSQGNGLVTLREEERHLHSYLQIQQVRYQDILEYEISFPEDIMGAAIPKITLQPLVENALYHGIKNRRGKGFIRVSAARAEGGITITVEDNGIGMTPERLEQIKSQLEQHEKDSADRPENYSYGLYNVNERIKLKFGEQYGLVIRSIYGEGTSVMVKIPFCRTES